MVWKAQIRGSCLHQRTLTWTLTRTRGLALTRSLLARQGEPTDNARRFYDWVMSAQVSLPGLRYAVFGLGSKKTHADRFCIVGKNVDARLAHFGADQLAPRVDGDDSGANLAAAQSVTWMEGIRVNIIFRKRFTRIQLIKGIGVNRV